MAANGMHLSYYNYFTVLSYGFAAQTDCLETHKSSNSFTHRITPIIESIFVDIPVPNFIEVRWKV
jgi:hypothetical protein